MKKRKRVSEVAYDDGDDEPYVPSDSEDEYSESEKILLEKTRKGNNETLEESEEELFGLGDEDSSNDGKMSDSDIEGKEDEDDDLPDVRAWGKKRKNYYSTDYVDQDYGGYDEKDMEAAEQEEAEARAIQKRLVEQLDEADFSLDLFSKKDVEKEAEPQEVIKTDLRKMSKRQKLALMQKESPEFFGLVDDFKKSMVELQDKLEPMLKLIKEGKIPASPADDYVRTKYHLLLNYCTNISFYLLLKAKCIAVQSHPVIRRLYQFRQLLKQLEPVDLVVMPQIEFMLEEQLGAQGDNTPMKSKKKMLKLLSRLEEEKLDDKDHTSLVKANTHEKDDEEDGEEENQEVAEVEEEEGKRSITYQIAKNKGLTPYRKKENRNPRVKHRNKFRKAKIRRKGQVREPRKELQKYGGEISGIKIGVVKSIKLK